MRTFLRICYHELHLGVQVIPFVTTIVADLASAVSVAVARAIIVFGGTSITVCGALAFVAAVIEVRLS